MKPLRLAAIVEGHGEVEAVPVLIRRIAAELDPSLFLQVEPILRTASSQLRKEGELERRVEYAARKLGGRGGILILIDCDWSSDACPKFDALPLLERICRVRPDMPISVVLACQEYEAWFIASAESLRGQRGLPIDLTSALEPERIRGAKEWLSNRMPRTKPYTETTDQAALTQIFDMAAARRADSFDKCYREITGLLNRLRVKAAF
ncbi:MAG: DUF4276 family protein [Syntrophales bacterium]